MDLEKALIDGATAYAIEKGMSHAAEKIAGMDQRQREETMVLILGIVVASALFSD